MPNNKIKLPPLDVTKQVSCGEIRHVIVPANEAGVVEIKKIQISPRIFEDLYILDNGESIIVTKRSKVDMPDVVDGVLRLKPGGSMEWSTHRKISNFEQRVEDLGWEHERDAILKTWSRAFHYNQEIKNAAGEVSALGLRPPQIGALHAVAAHWSLHQDPATIVMPTGTGKTETMLAVLASQVGGPIMVALPSRALRDQTIRKFESFGLLRKLGCLEETARNPIVGVIEHRPREAADLEIFNTCNVVVGTMAALAQGTASDLAPQIAARAHVLIVDEAHHVPAQSWMEFRDHFKQQKILQFTATPYRRDGQLVDGKVIYSYPLGAAQRDGYFKPIHFETVHEIDEADGDVKIAQKAVEQLKKDRTAGLDHIVMARCGSIERARAVLSIYEIEAAEFNPVLVHSELRDSDDSIDKIRSRASRVVVCVDMLGEGFDLPQLKIAAVHDTHKSLAVLLQFTGRFTRVAGDDVGDATVIANIATPNVSAALERLYTEDADWNKLLREYSSQAIREHAELVEFLASSQRLDDPPENPDVDVSQNTIRPKFSAVAYKVRAFQPRNFHKGLSESKDVRAVWLNETKKTLYFVTLDEPGVDWTRSKDVKDREWHVYVLHYDEARGLLYLHSSDKTSTHERLAKAVSNDSAQLISGDVVFRVLGGINRLLLQIVGVKKHGRRNLRYAMYVGEDVKQALSAVESGGSVKSNVTGSGWENRQLVRVGCSAKGRVWSVETGTILEFVKWCTAVGGKLLDDTIDTSTIINNALVPTLVTALPEARILSVEWPLEILHLQEDRVVIKWEGHEVALWAFELVYDGLDSTNAATSFEFKVQAEGVQAKFVYELGVPETFRIRQVDGPALDIKVGSIQLPMAQYLSDYPPLVRFVDMSELDGALLLSPKNVPTPTIGDERFETWDWSGTDITVESMWRGGRRRPNSIQEKVARYYQNERFSVVFDDDGAGEAADLVCMKEEGDDCIRLALVHCKFSSDAAPGGRIADIVEVAAQAERSAKRISGFKDLCRHLLRREKERPRPEGASRFIVGDQRLVSRLEKACRFKRIETEVVVVQPGLSFAGRTQDQNGVLAAAQSFLKQTVGVDLDVICSP